MAIKQEQVVFAVTAALLGWWVSGDLSQGSTRGRSRGGSRAPELEAFPAPDPALALAARDDLERLPRDLFTPPRDTAPLPPLGLETPPEPPLDALWPPPARSLGIAAYSELLRTPVVAMPAPGLFETALTESAPAPFEDVTEEEDEGEASLAIGGGDGADAEELLSAEERAERIASWKRLYDWLEPANGGALRFGSIVNGERYTLDQRPAEPIEFVEVKPDTGERVHPPNFPPVLFEPERLASWSLADTPSNRVSLFRARVGGQLRPGDLVEAMQMVDLCIAERHNAPGLLDTAVELAQLATSVFGEDGQADPFAVLKLAEVYEAGFRGEEAYALYRGLVEGGQRTNAVAWARMAQLEARYRLFDLAEEHFLQAIGLNGANHFARLAYGRFLLDQGRGAEAVEHLLEAERREPRDSEGRALRVLTRSSLGHAHLAAGDPTKAAGAFGRAIAADDQDPDAVAGLLAAALLTGDEVALGDATAAAEALAESGSGATFDLLVATGVAALREGNPLKARRQLTLAAESDPFRASEAWRALSWLAEITGHPEEASGFIEQAWQADPTDAWTLYQRARLLMRQDDLAGAHQMLREALDQELDFAEALIAMGKVAQLEGRATDAELYFERALGLDPGRPALHTRRGFNLLRLADVVAAEASFTDALAADRGAAGARSGLAWCAYAQGDSREALSRYGELAEFLRDPADPQRQHAEGQAARIVDHEAKEVWSDSFTRPSGMLLGNGWTTDIGFGPEVTLEEGNVRLAGLFETKGTVRVFREEPVDAFLSYEAVVTVSAETRARVGIFLARERVSRTSESQTLAAVRLTRAFGSAADLEPIQAELAKQGELDNDTTDLFTTTWEPGVPLRMGIVRRGEGSETVVDLFVDGEEVLSGIPMSRLFAGTSGMRFGLMVQGDQGRTCEVTFDEVRVVRRKQP